MGRADYLQPGDWNAMCFTCGGKFKASMLRKHWTGPYKCPRCWTPRQPQDFVRAIPDVQTPPWVQPWPIVSYVLESFPISTTGNYTVSGGSGSIVITIQPGVTVPVLTIDSGPTSIIINNYGTVQSVVNNSSATPTVNNFNGGVYPGVPWKLVFSVQPSNASTNASISPAVEVSIEDAFGTVVTSWPNEITIRVGLDANSGGATLSGTLSAVAVNGVATFSDLSLDQSGTGYTLWANGSDAISGDLFYPVISDSFDITSTVTIVVTCVTDSGYNGYETTVGTGGSVDVSEIFSYTITDIATQISFGNNTFLLKVSGSAPQDLFTSLHFNVSQVYGSNPILSADATYAQSGGFTTWQWTHQYGFGDNLSVTVVITQ